MRRLWIKYDVKFGGRTCGVLLGCGVTAHTREEALEIAARVVFHGDRIPRYCP
jgi:hypothetical protein